MHIACSRVDKEEGSVFLRGQEGDGGLGPRGERPARVGHVATVARERDGVARPQGSSASEAGGYEDR